MREVYLPRKVAQKQVMGYHYAQDVKVAAARFPLNSREVKNYRCRKIVQRGDQGKALVGQDLHFEHDSFSLVECWLMSNPYQ